MNCKLETFTNCSGWFLGGCHYKITKANEYFRVMLSVMFVVKSVGKISILAVHTHSHFLKNPRSPQKAWENARKPNHKVRGWCICVFKRQRIENHSDVSVSHTIANQNQKSKSAVISSWRALILSRWSKSPCSNYWSKSHSS